MPFSFCKKINAQPNNFSIQIVQLERTRVKILGELKYVFIWLSSNPKVHQTIDIIIVDIQKSYGLLFSRHWSGKLHGYFSIDWSHMWLPYNGKPNQIKFDREKRMKYTMIDIDGENEPIYFSNSILGNYYVDSFFGNNHCRKFTIHRFICTI
jgi:hypothetical protein